MYAEYFNTAEGYGLLGGFNSVFVCDDEISVAKQVDFPNGWDFDTNLSFKVLFKNGHNCADASTPMTLNGVVVVVNKYGTLIPLPIHEMDNSGTLIYKSLQPNTILEMYYTDNYDGADTPAYVVIGNPIVLSSTDYTIYANGQIGEGNIGDIKSGMWTTAPYGWLLCDGATYDTAKYSKLYDFLGTNKLPDLRECVLVGAGQSSNEYNADTNPNGIHEHDVYSVGEFKDDQLQNITGSFRSNQDGGASGAFDIDRYNVKNSGTDYYAAICSFDASRVARAGTTTHGKQVGVNYCIKAL